MGFIALLSLKTCRHNYIHFYYNMNLSVCDFSKALIERAVISAWTRWESDRQINVNNNCLTLLTSFALQTHAIRNPNPCTVSSLKSLFTLRWFISFVVCGSFPWSLPVLSTGDFVRLLADWALQVTEHLSLEWPRLSYCHRVYLRSYFTPFRLPAPSRTWYNV